MDLADKVKALHGRLRRECQLLSKEDGGGDKRCPEDVWRSHLEDEVALRDYAEAMRGLAEGKWTQRKAGKEKSEGDNAPDRISWTVKKIDRYFRQGDIDRLWHKAMMQAKVLTQEADTISANLSTE